MEKYVAFLERYKYQILIVTTLFVLGLSVSLKNIDFEGSYRIWFNKDSKIIKDYDAFRSRFSGDDTFIVSFKDESGIFNERAINTILSLTKEFKKIQGVQKVESLTNYQYIYALDDDLIVEDFFYEPIDLEVKQKIALQDNLILNQLISKDGKTTLIAIKLQSALGSDEKLNLQVMEEIQNIVNIYEKLSRYRFYISGGSAITASLVSVAKRDALILLPAAVGAVVVLLFLFFRGFVGVVVPSIVIVFTFLLVLSMQMILGYKLNNFTVNIPSFVSAIAIADSIHLYLAWIYYKHKNMTNYEAVYWALKTNIIPIALTSFTTGIGFASLGLSDVEPVATLGIAITSAALIAFILSVSVAPAVLLMLKDDYQVQNIRFLHLIATKGYGAFIKKYDKIIVFGFSFVFMVLLYGLSFVKIDSNSIKYFSKDTVVRSGSDFVQENLTGSMVYEIIIDSKQKEGIKDPQFLQKVVLFEDDLKKEFSNITFSSSLKDVVVRMQKVLNKDSNETIPKDKNLIAQYILLYSMSLPQGMEINDKIDTFERYLRLSINSDIQDTSKDLMMIEWIKNWWKQNSSYTADIQGQTSIFAYMQKNVTNTLIVSICTTLVIVTFVMLLIFRRFKILLLFVLPNILPILLVGGVMGYLGITIDIGVAISAAVILGIAVDDTIHFFSKFFDSIKLQNFEDSIDYVIAHSGNAMILTTVILSITFALFALSSFVPNVNFAIVTVVALNLALLFDLVLMPAILSIIYKGK